MTPAQRRLLLSADKEGRLPDCAHRSTLKATLDRSWVVSKREEPTKAWLGYFITPKGQEALKETE